MAYDVRDLRLIKPISTGDLATIYLATDPERLNVSRAVSIFHADLEGVDNVALRVSERARRARRLKHPGVAQSEGVFMVGGKLALVGEIVDGKDLERLSKRKAIPGPVAARIGAEVVAVLLAAKEEGLMHGLLSPERVRISSVGQVRVHAFGDDVGGTFDAADALFREDRGSRRYAAPEMGQGLLTSAADVYALGAILTRMISGRWPKRASSHASGQKSVADGAATVLSHAGASHAIVDLIKDCMGFRGDLRPSLNEAYMVLHSEAIDNAGWASWLEQTVLSHSEYSESSEAGDLAATDLNEPQPKSDVAAVQVGDQQIPEPVRLAIPTDDSDKPSPEPELEPEPEPEPEPVLKVALQSSTPILGNLPPPPNTDEVARPLAVAGDQLMDADTECTADPDTVDEQTEEVTKEIRAQIDENADAWDRMLGLDLKADDKLDKEWVRAARGESEHQRWVIVGAVAIFIGILGAWKLGLFEADSVPGTARPSPEPAAEITVPPQPEAPVDLGSLPEPEAESEVLEDRVIENVSSSPVVEEPVAAPPPAPKATAPPPASQRRKSSAKASPAPRAKTPPPAPAPPPPPPVAQPDPSIATAAFRVTGDAHEVVLIDGSDSHTGGRVPPGSYTIKAVFRAGDEPQTQGVLTLEAGESAIVNCKGAFYRCTIRGPWK